MLEGVVLHITGGIMLEGVEVDTPNLCSFWVTCCQVLDSSIVGCKFEVRLEEKCRHKNSLWDKKLEDTLEFCTL